MSKNKTHENKNKSLLNNLVVPIITALVVGGTAPWWVDFIKGDSSNSSPEERQGLEQAGTNDSVSIQGSENTVNDSSVIAQDQSTIQQSNGTGSNFSAGRDITVNATSNLPEITEFQGEIGHYGKSQEFTSFVFENQGEPVLINAHYEPDDFYEISVSNNSFGVDYFKIWNNCSIPLEPNEEPSSMKCHGTTFSIDRSDIQKDADFTYVRGILRVEGYFAIKGCSGPYQGSFGCTLRPLNPEDIR